MKNFRKGRIEELPRHGSAGRDSFCLPAGKALTARPKASAIGRGRHYFMPVSAASPLRDAQGELESLLDMLLAGAGNIRQNVETEKAANCAPDPGPADGLAMSRAKNPSSDAGGGRPEESANMKSAFVNSSPMASADVAVSLSGPLQAMLEPLDLGPAEPGPGAAVCGEQAGSNSLKLTSDNCAPGGAQSPASFLSALLTSTEKQKREIAQDDFNLLPAPVRKTKAGATTPVLMRAWEWFRKNQTLTHKKQLRVSDTVGLGDKRFVALLHFEGRKFLIGGGGSNVSLLSELGDGPVISGAMKPAALPGSAE